MHGVFISLMLDLLLTLGLAVRVVRIVVGAVCATWVAGHVSIAE